MAACTHCGLSHDMTGPDCPITDDPLDVAGLCGTTIDRYRVERWLGGGGFGAVYRASHTVMERSVALKVLHADLRTDVQAFKRFFGEAKAAAAVGSPYIIQVFDAGTTDDGHAFLAMELVEGCSLKDLAKVGPIEPARAVRIVVDVLQALAAAHRAGIIHRDVKPGNVMLGGTTPDGSDAADDVRLVDFGISKARQTKGVEDLTRSGMSMGSPGYAAPEQYVSAKDADARSDLYGVCAVLYRLLSGSMPFEAQSYEEMIVQVCTKDAPPLGGAMPSLPEALSTIVDRGLAREPDARWQTAEDLLTVLTPWVSRLGGASTAPLAVVPTRRSPPALLDNGAGGGVNTQPMHADPDDSADLPAVQDSQSVQGAVEAATTEAKERPRNNVLFAATVAVVVVAGVTAGFVITTMSDGHGAPETPSAPTVAPVVPEPVPVPAAASDSPGAPAVGPVTADSPTSEVPTIEPAPATSASARRRARRARARNRGRMTKATQMPESVTPMERGLGLEDIEPFDPE